MVILFPDRVYGDFYMTATTTYTNDPSVAIGYKHALRSLVRLLKRETRPSNPISDGRGDSLSFTRFRSASSPRLASVSTPGRQKLIKTAIAV